MTTLKIAATAEDAGCITERIHYTEAHCTVMISYAEPQIWNSLPLDDA